MCLVQKGGGTVVTEQTDNTHGNLGENVGSEEFVPQTTEDFFVGDPRYPSVNIDSDLQYLRYLHMAKFPELYTDEDKVSAIFKEYRQETNAFAKKEFFDRELANINQEIAKYQGEYYFKAPLIMGEEALMHHALNDFVEKQTAQNLTAYIHSYKGRSYWGIEAYNFDSKGFELGACDFSVKDIGEFKLGSTTLGNYNFVDNAVVFSPKEECVFVVEDENVARKIEEARNNNPEQILIVGQVYYKVDKKDKQLYINPVHAQLGLFNIQESDMPVSTLNLTWGEPK